MTTIRLNSKTIKQTLRSMDACGVEMRSVSNKLARLPANNRNARGLWRRLRTDQIAWLLGALDYRDPNTGNCIDVWYEACKILVPEWKNERMYVNPQEWDSRARITKYVVRATDSWDGTKYTREKEFTMQEISDAARQAVDFDHVRSLFAKRAKRATK